MNISERAKALDLDVDDYRELFIETSRSDIAALKSAIEQGDAEKITAAAHSLKGASGNLGFMELHGMASQIVEKARGNRLEGLSESFDAMKKTFDALIQEVYGV